MAKVLKKNKKIVRKKSGRREVEIPIFVISKKEKAAAKAEEKKFGIFKDRDNLPVFKNFFPGAPDEEKNGLKEKTHKEAEALIYKKESLRKKSLLPESGKRIIMWASVAVFACLIFFMWFSGLKNNFSGWFGSASYTFDRQGESLEEVGNGAEEVSNGAAVSEEEGQAGEVVDGKEILDQIKEKILVEELKNKLE